VDITLCGGGDCQIRTRCLRHTWEAAWGMPLQSHIITPPHKLNSDGESICDYFIDTEKTYGKSRG
jgi:hypothetical protein